MDNLKQVRGIPSCYYSQTSYKDLYFFGYGHGLWNIFSTSSIACAPYTSSIACAPHTSPLRLQGSSEGVHKGTSQPMLLSVRWSMCLPTLSPSLLSSRCLGGSLSHHAMPLAYSTLATGPMTT